MKDPVQLQTCTQLPQAAGMNDESQNGLVATEETAQKAGDSCPAASGPNMEMIQLMVNQLNTEIATFRSSQPGDEISSNRNSCIDATFSGEASPSDQVKAATNSVNVQIARVKKQIELQKKFMKDHSEERQNVVKVPETSLDDVKASIDILKTHMEAINVQQIADIVPQESNDTHVTNEVAEDAEDSVNTDTSDKGEDQSNEGQEEQNVKEPNAKAKDDLLKKYLLLKVVKDNLGLLTAKMNKILAAKGIEPANVAASNKGPEPIETVLETSVPKTDVQIQEEQAVETDIEQYDESCMYGEDEEGELYTEENEHEDGSQASVDTQTSNCVNESVEISSEENEGTYTTSQPSAETNTGECSSAGNDNTIIEEKAVSRQVEEDGQQTDVVQKDPTSDKGNAPLKLFESTALADAEAFLKTYKKKWVAEKDDIQSTKVKDNVMDAPKTRTYTLLLKLQKEMADMQLQVSRLQDHMRSTNAALQIIFDYEFSDMQGS